MFKDLKKQKNELNRWLISRTHTDLASWIIWLLLIGGVLILIFLKDLGIKDRVSFGVLWITAGMIAFYTKETYELKQLQKKDLEYQKAPFIIVNRGTYDRMPCFILKNVGKGVAKNINWSIDTTTLTKKYGFPNCPLITAIPSGEKLETLALTDWMHKLTEIPKGEFYQIQIDYEDCDGAKYRTLLKSGITNDDYEVLEYRKR